MVARTVSIDFSRKIGKIKPVSGVNSGPLFGIDLSYDLTENYRELAIPAVRVSDTAAPYGGGRFVDIRNVFPDPLLDERFPESYNFAPTDKYLAAVKAAGAEIYLRLGESRDPYEIRPRLSPHLPPEKWARVCEKIIDHYNRGWGCGFKHGIKYVEIWSGADSDDGWGGTREEYFELYRTVSNHLKSVFPKLRVGAYSSGGFFALNHFDASDKEKRRIEFLEQFLSYTSKKATYSPLDFFSWECRAESPEELSLHSNYARSYLGQYGHKRAASVVSSFSLIPREGDRQFAEREYPAELASALIVAQKSSIDMMFCDTLDPHSPSNAILTLDDCRTVRKYAAYGVMAAFGVLSRQGTAVQTTDDYRREIYTLATVGNGEGAVLIATRNFSGNIELSLKNSPFTKYSIKGMVGGGERGAGYSSEKCGIKVGRGTFSLKVGRCEVYLITLTSDASEPSSNL